MMRFSKTDTISGIQTLIYISRKSSLTTNAFAAEFSGNFIIYTPNILSKKVLSIFYLMEVANQMGILQIRVPPKVPPKKVPP